MLWSLPTGIYLIGSRHGDTVNLMTANLVVQVCLEPKLVAVAMEAGSVTADLAGRGNAFTVSLLARQDKDVVRRFVKPVHDVVLDATGAVTALSAQELREVGASGCRCSPRRPATWRAPWSAKSRWGATRSSSERWVKSAESRPRCSAWRTRGCTTAVDPKIGPGRIADYSF